jgi:hypothetical protein
MEEVFKFGLVTSMVLAVGTFLMFMVPIAMRNFRKANLVERDTGGELEALRAELDDLRSLPSRMAELEERLDFAERMLTHQREGARLPGGPDAAR